MTDPAQNTSMGLGRLVESVLQQGLVEQCTLTQESLVIVLNGRTFTYGWNEGQQFLRLLLAGAGRTGAPSGRERADHDRGGRAERDHSERQAKERESAHRADAPQRQGRLREDYLDTMLTFAARAGFIEGFDKDGARGKVTLRTHATTTDLSFAETLEYLTSVVLDELSTVQPTSTRAGSDGDYPPISVLASE